MQHCYVSTACMHDLHDRCRKTCKFCESRCSCDCHRDRVVVDLKFSGDQDELTEAIVRAIRKRIRSGGGDVQTVLGGR